MKRAKSVHRRPTPFSAGGAPTGRYNLDDGALRLEYASGPFGRTTWMADENAAGRVMAARQVLNEASFEALWRTPVPLERDELLRALGRPGERQRLGQVNGEIWSWRYPTNDCLWVQATLDGDGRVLGSGYAPDPACDAGPAHD